MPRLIRRRPLAERLQAYLNPLDFLLWLSEEIETRDWNDQSFANPLGIALNLIFLLARANSNAGRSNGDDVFGESGGSDWLGWLAVFIVHFLTWLCIANAAYTFLQKRHYRLFENPVDNAPDTPSAHRVRVDHLPVSSSPLRLFSKIIGDQSAVSRSHPDPTRDVWELAVWNPLPVCLRLFCLFSPGNILVYWLFLPIPPSDPRPSTTVVTTIFLASLLSAQLLLLESNFRQQAKDIAIIHKEVLNEYDTKYVHPQLNHPVRDVGIQYTATDHGPGVVQEDEVVTYTPTTILRRGFQINPNPNYIKHIDPDDTGVVSQRTALTPNSLFKTPATSYNRGESTPLRTTNATIRQPQFRQSMSSQPSNVSTRDGGSLGIYNHANSPLKKASSMYDIQGGRRDAPKNSLQAAVIEISEERERSMSPVKRLQQSEKGNGMRRTSVPLGYGRTITALGKTS